VFIFYTYIALLYVVLKAVPLTTFSVFPFLSDLQ